MTEKRKNIDKVPNLRFPEFEDEWEKKKFSKYIKLFRGSSPRPIVKFITKDENGVNWIKIGDTKNTDNSIINNVEEKITIEGARKSRKVTNGELILANSMSFGKTYQLSIDGYIYDGWFVLREYENYFEKSFLLQLLNSDYLQKQYKRLSAGGVVQNISSEIVYETILIRPSLQEQKKISSFLSLIDENITTQRKTIESLESLIKGVSQKLLTQKVRFKKFTDEWKDKRLGEICNFYKGSPLSKNNILEDGNSKCIHYGELFTTYKVVISEIISRTNKRGFKSEIGDILMPSSDVTPLGLATASAILEGNVILGGDINIIRPTIELNSVFLSYLLNFGKKKIIELVSGTTIKHIYSKDLKQIKISIPNIEEQTKIADFLSKISDKIETEKKILELLEQQKKYFLQNLFI